MDVSGSSFNRSEKFNVGEPNGGDVENCLTYGTIGRRVLYLNFIYIYLFVLVD